MEYILIVAVLVGLVLVIAKPFIGSLSKKMSDSFQKGLFADDGTGGGFYYFSVK